MTCKICMLMTTIVAVAVLTMSSAALAAKPGAKAAAKGEQRGQLVRIQHVLDKLDLTDAQAKKIGEVIASAQQQLQQLRDEAKSSGDKTAVREKVRALMADTLKKISTELTPEQKTKLRTEMQKMREERRAERGATTRPAK